MKKILGLVVAVIILAVNPTNVFAHVTVTPEEVTADSYHTFTVSAPTHGFVPVTEVRVVIPDGVINVMPTVKTGWDVTVVREGQHVMPDGTVMDNAAMEEGEHAGHHSAEQVKEIIWTGGVIPGEHRDDFSFSAKTPKETTTLFWKAYQTFSDGKVVSWELLPEESYPKTADGEDDVEHYGPASETKVVRANEASVKETEREVVVAGVRNSADRALMLSFVALILATGALGMQFMKKKK